MALVVALTAGIAVYLIVAVLIGVAPRFTRPRRVPAADPIGLELWLLQAGSTLTPQQFVAGSLLAGALGLVLAGLATGLPAVAVVPGIAAGITPRWLLSRQRARRQAAVVQAWPDAIREIGASIHGGDTVHQALVSVVRNGPEATREAFGRYPMLAQVSGPAAAMTTCKEQQADPVTDRVFEVLLLAHERGGDALITVLDDLAETTADDLRTTEEIKTLGLEQRLNYRATFVLPWVTLMVMCAINETWRQFFATADGVIVVGIGLLWSGFGAVLASRIGRQQPEPRVFVMAPDRR